MIIGIDYRQIVSDMQNVKKRSLAFIDDDKQQVNKNCYMNYEISKMWGRGETFQ